MKLVNFGVGITVIFMGLVPYIAKLSIFNDSLAVISEPGSMIYQGILIGIGVLSVLLAFSGRRRNAS